MFGRMFPKPAAARGGGRQARRAREAMIDSDPARADRRQPEHTRRLHLSRPVRRSRHHARPDLARRARRTIRWHRELPDAERSISTASTGSVRTAARTSTRAIRQTGNKHRAEAADRQEHQCRLRRRHRQFPERPAAQPEGFALIGDHRNDENLLVAQTHLALLKFHNKVCDMLSQRAHAARRSIFAEARRIVDLALPVDRASRLGRAAHREGHRREDPARRPEVLPLQEDPLHAGRVLGRRLPARPQHGARGVRSQPGLRTGSRLRQPLFAFTGLSGGILGDLAPNPPTGPTPVPVLPSNWIIDWRRFYELGPSGGAAVPLNLSRKLDPLLVPALHTLPGGGGDLAVPQPQARREPRDFRPARTSPSSMKIKKPLTPDEIASDSDGSTDGAEAKKQGLHTADAALVLHPQGGEGPPQRRAPGAGRIDHHLGGLRRPHPRRPQLVPVARAGLEADAAIGEGRRLHHGRPAPLRERHQPDRRLNEATPGAWDHPRAVHRSRKSSGRPRPDMRT